MISKQDVENCRHEIAACVGHRVRLRSSGGRKRIIIREGILEDIFPNVFTVRCLKGDCDKELVTYSYVDVLTGTVEVGVEPEVLDEIQEMIQPTADEETEAFDEALESEDDPDQTDSVQEQVSLRKEA